MSGPAPKPTARKVIEGNPGKRRLNLSEPSFSAVSTDPRPSAKLSTAAKKLWREKVAAIGAHGIRATDIPALTMLVQAETRAFDLAVRRSLAQHALDAGFHGEYRLAHGRDIQQPRYVGAWIENLR